MPSISVYFSPSATCTYKVFSLLANSKTEKLSTFLNATLGNYEYMINNTDAKGWFNFSPNTTPLKAIETMLEVLPQWKIKELTDGTITIGTGFETNGMYVFYRDKDIFSRQIIRDDAEVFNRVCVHTNNFGKVAFREMWKVFSLGICKQRRLYMCKVGGRAEIYRYRGIC